MATFGHDAIVSVSRYGTKPVDVNTSRFDGGSLIASPAVSVDVAAGRANSSRSILLSDAVLALVCTFDALRGGDKVWGLL
jgi:hypothetical protein